MTTQLPERLRSLADEAPEALSAGGLWQTGRRRHRIRVAAALTAAACLVLGTALVGNGVWRSRQPSPAAPPSTPSGPMAVPDRFFHPSPWLPGTSAPGRLVALLGTERGHFPFGEELNARVGVTAGSQTYRFLDLPGQATDSDVALSPDGTHLAYWISGTPSGSARLGDRSVVGVANLDLTTGTVQRRVLPGRHGLEPGALTWTTGGPLAVATGRLTSAEPTSYSTRSRVFFIMWSGVGAGDVNGPEAPYTVLPHSNVLPIPTASTQGYAGMADHRLLRVYDANQSLSRTIHLSGPLKTVAYDAQHRQVAGTAGNADRSGWTSERLVVGNVVPQPAGKPDVRLTEVPGGHAYLSVLGWADAGHVVTEQLTATGELFWVVDVRTGARTALTTTGYQATGSRWFSVVLAEGALRHPTSAAAIAPPRPWDPRWVAGSALAAVVLVGSWGLWLVLRRRRVRR